MREQLRHLATPLLGRVQSFWFWWRETLEGLLPPDLLARLYPRRAIIRPGRTNVEIDLIDRAEGRTLREDRPLDALDDMAWEELVATLTDRQIVIVLPPNEGFSVRVALPRAAQRRPDATVALQLPAIAPLDADQLVWSWQPVGRSKATLTLIVHMVRHASIEKLRDAFAMRALPPPPVAVQTVTGTVPIAAGTRIWRSTAARRQRAVTRIALALFASIPFSTWLAATALLATDEPVLSELRAEVAPAIAAWHKARSAETLRQAMQPLAQVPILSAIVNDVSAALPAKVYLTALEIDAQGRVRMALAGTIDARTVSDLQSRSRLLDIGDVTPDADAEAIELMASIR